MPKISVVIPCYFNEGNIPVTAAALIENEGRFPEDVEFEYVMVDDGSEDATVEQLLVFQSQYSKQVKVIELEKNVGSYNAIFAGFEYATGNCVVVMSADLQDPPELILDMYQKWSERSKVVLAVRERRNDPLLTKLFAAIFHTVLRLVGPRNIPAGGSDFCLFDRSLIPLMKEKMISGMNSLLLLLELEENPVFIPYERRKRVVGRSRWTFGKKLKLAINTILYFLSSRQSQPTELYQIRKAHGIQ